MSHPLLTSLVKQRLSECSNRDSLASDVAAYPPESNGTSGASDTQMSCASTLWIECPRELSPMLACSVAMLAWQTWGQQDSRAVPMRVLLECGRSAATPWELQAWLPMGSWARLVWSTRMIRPPRPRAYLHSIQLSFSAIPSAVFVVRDQRMHSDPRMNSLCD